MRIPVRRFATICILFTVALVTWFYMSTGTPNYTKTCNQSEKFQNQLHKLTASVHKVLNQLELTHFLCFEALWGQIRLSRTLPWSAEAEICMFNEQVSQKDEVFMDRMFRKNELQLKYDYTDGHYTVTEAESDAKVVLIVFEFDKLIGQYRRVGWKRRLLPPDCENFPQLQCFPPRLAEPPLPHKDFGGTKLPVPREDLEIQKYHYRDNWWKEIVALNC